MALAALDWPFNAPHGSEWWYLAGAYLLGAIPFGLWIARARGIDLRQFGSGNIGAANATRALGKPLGLTVFALDVVKGALPVLCVGLVNATTNPAEAAESAWLFGAASQAPDVLALQVLAGAAAVLGHCFSIYLGFRGGKGVATGCGALVSLHPMIFVLAGLIWLAVLKGTRYVGLASICMGLGFPAVAWALEARPPVIVGASLLALLIVVRHRANIRRMLDGTEPRSGASKSGGGGARAG